MRDIGKNIRDLRTARGLTQEELAGALLSLSKTSPGARFFIFLTGPCSGFLNTLLSTGDPLFGDRKNKIFQIHPCVFKGHPL